MSGRKAKKLLENIFSLVSQGKLTMEMISQAEEKKKQRWYRQQHMRAYVIQMLEKAEEDGETKAKSRRKSYEQSN